MSKKRKEVMVIPKEVLIKESLRKTRPAFRPARYMTEKDRPRKRYRPRDEYRDD